MKVKIVTLTAYLLVFPMTSQAQTPLNRSLDAATSLANVAQALNPRSKIKPTLQKPAFTGENTYSLPSNAISLNYGVKPLAAPSYEFHTGHWNAKTGLDRFSVPYTSYGRWTPLFATRGM